MALKGKTCSRLLEPQKVAPNAKSWSKVAEHNRDRPNDNDDGGENITKKRNFAPFQTSENFIASRFGTARFVKCRRLFLELNSQGLYPCSNREGKKPETRR